MAQTRRKHSGSYQIAKHHRSEAVLHRSTPELSIQRTLSQALTRANVHSSKQSSNRFVYERIFCFILTCDTMKDSPSCHGVLVANLSHLQHRCIGATRSPMLCLLLLLQLSMSENSLRLSITACASIFVLKSRRCRASRARRASRGRRAFGGDIPYSTFFVVLCQLSYGSCVCDEGFDVGSNVR